MSPRIAIQAMPVLAMVLVALLFAVLLWLLHRNEVEDEYQTLIKDILWVEQNVNFHITTTTEKLVQLAASAGQDDGVFSAQAGQVVRNNPELERVRFLAADGRQRLSEPPGQEGADAAVGAAFTLARSLGRPVYTPVLGTGGVFEVHVPVFRGEAFAGMVVGVYSLGSLLSHHVPWWVAEKYQVAVVDDGGQILAEKSKVASAIPGPSHQVRLDPPGHGLAIVATLHAQEPRLARNILAAAIFALAASAVFSLWALRRHVQRRLKAEMALREEHAFRKAMEDSLTIGMRARDLSGRITYVNPAFCNMVGWSEAELVGCSPPMPYWIPEDMESTLAMHSRVLRGDAPPDGFEITFQRKDGGRFRALVYEAPLIDADGAHTGWMASVLDVTERRRADELERQRAERLQRTARLVTMGEMASTLAHELNQPLAAIASYNAGCLNMVQSGGFNTDELAGALSKLGVQAKRAGQIILRIHDFVRKREPEILPCPLVPLIENALGFVEAEAAKRGVEIRFLPGKGAFPVLADRILIEQVLLNLVRNAMEAMAKTPEGGRVLSVTLRQADDGEAQICVADRGCGIAAEIAANLFQPFFTTKEEGMGMGLNICRSIVEFHRGSLWFEPNPGGGSVFCFALPMRGD